MLKLLLITTKRHFLILFFIVSRTIMFLLPTSTKQCWFTRSPTNRHLLLLLRIWDREDIVLWSGFNLWGSEVWGLEVSMYFCSIQWDLMYGSWGNLMFHCYFTQHWIHDQFRSVHCFIEADVPLYIILCRSSSTARRWYCLLVVHVTFTNTNQPKNHFDK